MFNSNKKNSSPATANDIGDEFIHTMKDDLNPLAQVKIPAPTMNESSPFTSSVPIPKPAPTTTPPSTPPISKPLEKTAPIEKQPSKPLGMKLQKEEKIFASNVPTKKNSKSTKTIIISIITLLIMLALAGGGYYFWINKESFFSKNEPAPIATENELGDSEDAQIVISPLSEKYSSERPNYLSVNVESMTAEEIKKLISDTAREAGELQSQKPFEFIITDSNNNPIAFPIFSTLSNINLSPELLINFEEEFSFYTYNDEGNIRTGIAVEVKNPKGVLAEMLKEEKTNLINTLSFLFLYEDFSSNIQPFTSIVYSGVDVRYLNLNPLNTISIDYGLYDNKLIIGTSKNTFRIIIDNIISKKSTTTSNTLEDIIPQN